MGKHSYHRMPRYRPGSVFFRAGMLLIFSFGINLAAIEASYCGNDWIWFTIFCSTASILVFLYFFIVWSWLAWIDHSSDYTPVDESVDCANGHDNYPGERHHP